MAGCSRQLPGHACPHPPPLSPASVPWTSTSADGPAAPSPFHNASQRRSGRTRSPEVERSDIPATSFDHHRSTAPAMAGGDGGVRGLPATSAFRRSNAGGTPDVAVFAPISGKSDRSGVFPLRLCTLCARTFAEQPENPCQLYFLSHPIRTLAPQSFRGLPCLPRRPPVGRLDPRVSRHHGGWPDHTEAQNEEVRNA